MVLLDEVVMVDEEQACCRVTVNREGVLAPFLTGQGRLPAWFGLEMMAQTIGVWSGWHGRQQNGADPRPGMLLGSRGYQCQAAEFPAAAKLDVSVSLLMRDDKMASFEGIIMINGDTRASGRLTIYQPDEAELARLLPTAGTL